MKFDLWHIPLLVTAGIVTVALVDGVLPVGWRRFTLVRQARTVALGLVALLALVLLTFALGAAATSGAASVVAVATAVMEAAALRLAYLSYKDRKRSVSPAKSPRGNTPES